MGNMLHNFVLETANAPGTAATVNLAGAATGRVTFASVFTTGTTVFYFMDDGTQAEWGYGVFTSGAPNTLARNTVLGNTAGTTAKLNFAGTTRVYNEIPADNSLWRDNTNAVDFKGADAKGLPSINGGNPIAGFHNLIVNGGFRINQRTYVSGTALAAGVYAHDRWKAGTGGGTYTFSQTQPDTTVTVTAGTLRQIIEGTDLAGGTYTLSWAGTATASVDGGSFLASPITVSGKTAGTNITVDFGLGSVGKVQFEAGTQATAFERRPITTEQLLCWRYFWILGPNVIISGFTDGFILVAFQTVLFPVPMRTVPTVTGTFSSGSLNSAESVASITPIGFEVTLTTTATRGVYGITYNSGNTASAEL